MANGDIVATLDGPLPVVIVEDDSCSRYGEGMKDTYGQEICPGMVVAWGTHSHSGTVTLGVVRKVREKSISVQPLEFERTVDDDEKTETLGYSFFGEANLRSSKNIVVTGYTEEVLQERFKIGNMSVQPFSYESIFLSGSDGYGTKKNWREIEDRNERKAKERLSAAAKELKVPIPPVLSW